MPPSATAASTSPSATTASACRARRSRACTSAASASATCATGSRASTVPRICPRSAASSEAGRRSVSGFRCTRASSPHRRRMPGIRTLVVDDEALARDRLAGFLSGIDDVALVGQAADGVEALRMIEQERPELVFLDVQMPGMDGFEVLKALRPPIPQIVFSTAFDEYAIRAFDVGAVDYLLKPYARRRVEESVSRVRGRLGSAQNGPDWDALLRRLGDRRTVHVTQIPVHSGKRI